MSTTTRKEPPPFKDFVVIGTHGEGGKFKRHRIIEGRTIRGVVKTFIKDIDPKAQIVYVKVEGPEIFRGMPAIVSDVYWTGSTTPVRVYSPHQTFQ